MKIKRIFLLIESLGRKKCNHIVKDVYMVQENDDLLRTGKCKKCQSEVIWDENNSKYNDIFIVDEDGDISGNTKYYTIGYSPEVKDKIDELKKILIKYKINKII